jgi:MFS family permease
VSVHLDGPSPEAFARRHLRRNVLALGGDFALYVVGLAFVSQATVLPAFAEYLGAPNVVIGAIPAVTTLGWLLPSLFLAGHTEGLARKLPFVLRLTVWERAPFLVLALAVFVVAERAPAVALGVLLLVLLVTTGFGGALLPAWMDVVGHAIPITLRGRFFAMSNIAASIGGLAASAATAWILAAVPVPFGYGVCVLAAVGCMALSYVALVFTREPPTVSPAAPGPPLRAYLKGIPALLRRDRNMSWFLVARSLMALGAMGSGFFAVYALRTFAAPAWQVGAFTTMLLGGQLAGNIVLGWTADRIGHREVFAAGTVAMLVANVAALAAPSVAWLNLVFVLDGIYDSAVLISGLNILLELAPAAGQRPTYVGLGRTAVAPVAFCAPIAAGLVADAVGFPFVFAVAATFGLAGLGLLIFRVEDPRRRTGG